jgi:2-phosphoglycerate kinase
MSKKFQITDAEEGQVPFLRGILVRSLVNSGLAFDDAFAVADAVRERFQDEELVPRDVLRAATAALVRDRFGKAARDRYQAPRSSFSTNIMVIGATGQAMPFSEGHLVHSLQACAIEPIAARKGAHVVHQVVLQRGRDTIDSAELRLLVVECLYKHVSDEAGHRYLAWRRFKASGTPLILLIGGITGVGKSTLATELAYRLNIVRTQSTDIMREIIRSMLPPHLYPTLAYSSFEAWRGLPTVEGTPPTPDGGRVLDGFLNQFAAIKVAEEATLRRALVERQNLILEGIHVLPGRLRLGRASKQALVVPMTLAKVGRKKLRRQLEFRAEREPGRAAERYLALFDEICAIQTFLLDEADRENTLILANDDIDETVAEAMEMITALVKERFPEPEPEPEVAGSE